ncbi:MAG: hypothetical protein M1828_000700 [Chrysothrix sp. TS-e1954]|nr:MAG: hypothetical protein M1828_000700 [Chrysothrix sp. TS-e1954]
MPGTPYAFRPSAKIFSGYGTRFDPRTGLSFRETTLFAPKAARSSRSTTFRARSNTGSHGAASLETTVLHTIFRNLDGITADTLTGLPWQCARLIWNMAEKRGLMTLNMWKAFAIIYPHEATVGYYVATDSRPLDTLDNYRTSLCCDNFQWLTCLTIANVMFGRGELINLSNLHNLVALDVQRSDNVHIEDPIVDDAVVRNWARRAKETDGFPKLYCLILRNQPQVTAQSLQFLNDFPSLALYGVIGCAVGDRHEERANSVGWTSHDEDDTFRNLQREMEHSHTRDGPIQSAFKHSHRLRSRSDTEPQPDRLDDIPLLNFRIGTLSTGFLLSEALVFFRTMTSPIISKQPSNQSTCSSKRSEPGFANGNGKTSRKRLHIRASKQVDLSAYLNTEAEDVVVDVRCRPTIE